MFRQQKYDADFLVELGPLGCLSSGRRIIPRRNDTLKPLRLPEMEELEKVAELGVAISYYTHPFPFKIHFDKIWAKNCS